MDPFSFVHTRFEAMVRRHPDRVAVEEPSRSITYHVLNEHANDLAHRLKQAGLKPGVIVVVTLPSGIALVESVLAILKAGGIFLIADPGFPKLRLKQILSDCASRIWIGHLSQRETLLAANDEFVLGVSDLFFIDDAKLTHMNLMNGTTDVYPPHRLYLASDLPQVNSPDDPCYIFYTSGSTGEPKGVAGSHKGLAHFINWEINEFQIDEHYKFSQLPPPTFDAFLKDLWPPLCSGGALAIPSPHIKGNMVKLIHWIRQSKITLLACVPSIFRHITGFLAQSGRKDHFPALKVVFISGEMLYFRDLARWRAAVEGNMELVNLYGPTEVSIIKAFCRVTELAGHDSDRVPVGGPIDDTTYIHILDESRKCLPGETGEIFISSPYLSNGYYNDAQLTQEKFIPDIFAGGSRLMYRTGDLGRYSGDGKIELVGRADRQLKVNGIRVELYEIEKAVRSVCGAEEVVVVTENMAHDNTRLLCYYTGKRWADHDIRTALRELLHPALIPSFFVHLDSFPLNRNGKIDREKLPKPEQAHGTTSSPALTPEGQYVLATWQEVLSNPAIGSDDSFFAMGGNSLHAIQIVSRLYAELKVDISFVDVLQYPTVRTLTAVLANKGKRAFVAQPRASGERKFYATSVAQQRLHLLNTLRNQTRSYTPPGIYEFNGDLDVQILQSALAKLIDRHEVMRAGFIYRDGELMQFTNPAVSFALRYTDLRNDHAGIDHIIRTVVQDEVVKPWDMENGPLFRAHLVRMADDKYLLAFLMSHIISDGWSQGILMKEALSLYNDMVQGGECKLEPLKLQYKDYCEWQKAFLATADLTVLKNYWLAKLKGEQIYVNVPTDKKRAVVDSYNGATVFFTLNETIMPTYQERKRTCGVTDFVLLQSLVKMLLYVWSGQGRVAVASPIMSRNASDFEGVVGPFLNYLIFSDSVDDGMSFESLLDTIKQTTYEAFAHSEYPIEMLLNDLQYTRAEGSNPVYNVVMVLGAKHEYLRKTDPVHQVGGVTVREHPFPFSKTDVDLTFKFSVGDQVNGAIEYRNDLFHEDTIAGMGKHLQRIAAIALSDPALSVRQIRAMLKDERENLEEDDFRTSLFEQVAEDF